MVGLVGCQRYTRQRSPHTIYFRTPTEAFRAAVHAVQGSGYPLKNRDDERMYLLVESKIVGNYFSIQVFSNGLLQLTPTGRHVKDSKILKKLAAEANSLAEHIRDYANAGQPSSGRSPAHEPPSEPPTSAPPEAPSSSSAHPGPPEAHPSASPHPSSDPRVPF